MQVVAVDIGGTHARFAIAEVAGGRVLTLGEAVTLKTAEHGSFQLAWEDFGRSIGKPLPTAAAIAVAGPVGGEIIKFTNNPWIIRPALIPEKLGADRYVVVNDFAAVAHAVAQADGSHFLHLSGPETDLPETGVISVVGPGTGLGVAQLWRDGASYRVQPTEGGHIDFAPLDTIEDAILARLRKRHRRVSVERVVAGPGIVDIYEALALLEGRPFTPRTDRELWELGTSGEDSLAAAAVDRFCLSLGSVAGDLALAHGSTGVVMAGGLGLRIKDTLVRSGFADRFRAKGRFEGLMAAVPVKLITHPQPGLFGAAAAYAQAHSD
ncbi:glucokinase [Novosphingobium taihuense]|uniref:Glucokinase n=1 Tax=Novosphingobium taihuense TaxID=260085 RepID=A0A7W7AB73_9SPHN|nr:glucokinase [Novosphingobium taihuense]MBB4613794.1 glucokinase [Novosphingobium taihuense]TWH83303.1 glucokinase [Novosphingobium taihuense]